MAYGLLLGHVIDDVTWPPKVLWGSTVGYPSDSLASCYTSLHLCENICFIFIFLPTGGCYSHPWSVWRTFCLRLRQKTVTNWGKAHMSVGWHLW